MNPLVSIIITSYNIEQYIKEALFSCINQTYKNIEIICIDDYSTDQTFDILSSIKKDKINNIILYQQEYNKGPNSARQKGVELAKGKFIFFLDGDDYIPTNAIESLVKELFNNDYDIIFGNTQVFIENEFKKNIGDYEVIKGISGIEYLPTYFNKQHSIWGKLIKRSLFNNNINYLHHLKIGEDLGLMVQLLYHADKINYTSNITYNYRGKRNNSLTQKYSYTNQYLAAIPAVSFVCDYLQDKNILIKPDFFPFFHRYFYAFITSTNPPNSIIKHIKNIINKTTPLYKEKDNFTHYLHLTSKINLKLGHLYYIVYTYISKKWKRNKYYF